MGQIAALGGNIKVTNMQLRAWASSNGAPLYIFTIDNAINADISSAENRLWNHGSMTVGDPLYVRLTNILGFAPPMSQIAGYPA